MHISPVKSPNEKISTVFHVKNQELHVHTHPRGARCDLHVHSIYSGYDPTRKEKVDRWVETNPPKKLAVRECYTSPDVIYRVAKRGGMDFVTISDHDSVEGGIELVGFSPDDCFVSCEYTVSGTEGFFIHVHTPGLDVPKGGNVRLNAGQVRELHEDLKKVRVEGYVAFKKECDKLGVRCGLNHPSSVFNGPVPRANLLEDWVRTFDNIEIGSDATLENVVNIQLAVDLKRKMIYTGSDAHNKKRIGHSFTESMVPVSGVVDYLKAFDEGNVAIGSRSNADSFVERFATPIPLFVGDVYAGIRDYFFSKEGLKDYFRKGGWRKWAMTGGLIGLPVVLSAVAGPAAGILPFLLPEAFFFTIIPYKTAIDQRRKEARNAKRIWNDYLDMKLERELEPYGDVMREVELKRNRFVSDRSMIDRSDLVDVTGFCWIVSKFFGRFNWFSSTYKDKIK